MADVFRAVDPVRGEEVALKVIKPAFGARPEHITSEFRFIAGLRHPGIVRVFDYGLTGDGEPFFTMELCEGPDLFEYSGQVGAREAVLALRHAVATLGFVHARGIVHADLKPSNILMGRTPRGALMPRLLDFGIAWRRNPDGPDRSGRMGGTAHFMAPEAAEGVRSVATDLYALGVMLFQLLTGRFPFQGDTLWDVLDAHAEEPAPDPREFVPSAPPALCELTLRLLEKSPADRPAHAAEVVASLDAWLGGEAVDFAPRAAALAAHAEPLLVGRGDALGALVEVFDRAREGASPPPPARVFVVAGQPGMGKTRLLHEARIAAQLRGIPTVALSLAPDDPRPALLDRLEAAMAGVVPTAQLHPAGPAGATNPVRPTSLGLLARAQALGDALGALVTARGTAFATVDDLHRASPEAFRLLHVALGRAARAGLTVAVAAAPPNAGAAAGGRWPIEEALGDVGPVTRVELGRLDSVALQGLVTSVLGEVEGLPSMTAQLMREAGGRPGAAVATLRAWLTMGALVPRGSGWGVGAHLQGTLPPPPAGLDAESALEVAVSELPPALARVAAAASVLGARFDVELLVAALGGEAQPQDVEASVQALVRRDLVAPVGARAGRPGDRGRVYEFVQEGARRVLRRRAGAEDARRWAMGAAELLGRRRGRGEPVSLVQLAELLGAAGGGVEVVEVASAAARELVASGAAGRAVEVLWGALRGLGAEGLDPPERRMWARGQLLLGELAARVGQRDIAARALEAVLGLGVPSLTRAARRQRAVLDLEAATGDEEREACHEALRQLGAEARAAEDWREAARAEMALAYDLVVRGRQEDAEPLVRAAVEDALRSGEALLLARARRVSGTAAWYRRDSQTAAELAREAGATFERLGAAHDAARAFGLLGNVFLGLGEYDPAEEAFERARGHAEEAGWLVGVSKVLNSLAQVRHRQLDWEGARERWIEARRISDLTDLQIERCVVRNNLGLLALHRGAYLESRALLEEALSIAEHADLQRERARTLGNLGELHRRLGARGEAHEALRHAIAVARDLEEAQIALEAATSELALALEEPASQFDELEARARALLETAAEGDAKDEAVRLHVLLARILARRGAGVEARMALSDAFDVAGHDEVARADVVLAAVELARRGVSGLRAFTERVPAVIRLAQRLRAQPLLARARELGAGPGVAGAIQARTPQGDTVPAWPASPTVEAGSDSGVALESQREELSVGPGAAPPRMGGVLADAAGDVSHEERQRTTAEGRTLALLQELGEIEDLNALLERVVDVALELAHAERGFVLLVDAQGRPVVRVARPASERPPPGWEELSRTVVRRALEGHEVVSYGGAEDVAPSASAAALGRAITALPLRWRARPVGVLYLDGPVARASRDAVAELQALAVHLAASVRNAWLLEEHRRRADMLLTVAQDLVHPLTTILGYAALLEASGVRPDHARVIRAQARRAATVLEHLVDVGRLEGRELAWTMVSVQVKDLVFSAVEQAEPLAVMAGVRIHADVPPGLPTVWGNRDRLVQALTTFLVDAVEQAERGDGLSLSARAVTLTVGTFGEARVGVAQREGQGGAPGARAGTGEVTVGGTDGGASDSTQGRPRLSPDRLLVLSVERSRPAVVAPAESAVEPREGSQGAAGSREVARALGAPATGRLLATRIVQRHGGRVEVHEPAALPKVFTVELPTLA